MDQNTANELFEVGAVLLFLDAPPNMEFGVDCYSWKTGPKFKGLKLIPPGMHFIYYSALNREGENAGIRTGFWMTFLPRQVVVKRWNPAVEDVFEDGELDSEETERFRKNFREFDRFLGVYPLLPVDKEPVSAYQRWLRLTTHITPTLVKKILPPSGKISAMRCVSRFSDVDDARPQFQSRKRGSTSSETPDPKNVSTDMPLDSEASVLPTVPAKETVEVLHLNFTSVDLKRSFPSGASGADRTKYSMDKSYLLGQVLTTSGYQNYKDLLGELQLSFIVFLIGEVFDGYEQWKTIVHLLCQSSEALQTIGGTLFLEFTMILTQQLEAHPADFFMDPLSADNFIRANLVFMTQSIRDQDAVPASLSQAWERLLDFVESRFKWEIRSDVRLTQLDDEDSDGEYAPVVVEI
ncbi:a1-alpha2 repression [Thoreauomyces humboldtii]|nr:a1-alpha2 repression [Thoreauomyces humboldtii]